MPLCNALMLDALHILLDKSFKRNPERQVLCPCYKVKGDYYN